MGLFVIAAVLLIVVGSVIALRAYTPPPSNGHHPNVIVPSGKNWTLAADQFDSVKFTGNENASFSGYFTANPHPVNVLLMNPTQYFAFFYNNTSQPSSLYATDGVYYGYLSYELPATGIYYLVGWNYDPNHGTTLTWVTDVQCVNPPT